MSLAAGYRPTPAAAPAGDASLAALRGVVFVASLLLAWVTLHPFENLATNAALELSSGNETFTYAAFALLGGTSAALAGPRLRHLGRCLRAWPIFALGGWIALSSLISQDPATSLKRAVLSGLIALVVACLFLMPRDQRDLARLLAIAIGATLILSYLGLAIVPDLAIHQASDVMEPQLAGDWRGVFDHKNSTAAVCSLFMVFGLFIARSGFPLPGFAILGASAVFVVGAGGKSAMGMVGVAILLGFAWEKMRGRFRVALALLPLAAMLTLGLGSVVFPPIGAFVRSLPIDATFTGRTDIWAFGVDKLQGHLAMGYGFQSFWNTAATRFGSDEDTWAGHAAHAHNGFLDMAIGTGLIGLALTVVVFIVMPVRDALAAQRRGADPALLTMLVQVWLFGLYLSAMESFLFNRDHPTWITFLFAVLGLRFAACHRLKGQAAGGSARP